MAKHLKKAVQVAYTHTPPVENGSGVGVFLLVLTVAVLLFWFGRKKTSRRKRKNFLRPDFRKSFAATEKQILYLENLAKAQNFYRAHPASLEDWLAKRSLRLGFISATMASELIQSLKSENDALDVEFEKLKRSGSVGKFRGEIFVSDLRTFGFCEMASYFSSHQYPGQNLIDLGAGQQIHNAFSNSETRAAGKSAKVFEFIRKQDVSVARVEWLPNKSDASLRHQSLPLTGRPDGYVHFRDGTKAIIELKSVVNLPVVARASDFNQADAYALLASTVTKVRNETLVLYTSRFTHELALYRRERKLTDFDLAQVIAKIQRGSRSVKELNPAKSSAQCRSCGYRSVCSRQVSDG